MLILDATTKTLEIDLAGAVSTNQLPVVVSYVDVTTTAYTPASTDTQTNSTTAVTIVTAPAASTQRQIKLLTVYNADTASATVTIQLNNNATLRSLVVVTLAVGSTLVYTDGEGWRVLTSAGAIVQSTLSPMTSAQLATILSDETGSGAAVFATSPVFGTQISTPAIVAPAALTITPAAGSDVTIVNSTSGRFEVINTDGATQSDITATTYGVNGGGILHGRSARGTQASPTAILSGDIFAGVGGRAYHSGGAFQTSSPTSLHWVASEDQTASAYGSYLRILTTPKGSTTRQERVIVSDSGTLWAHDTGTFDPAIAAQTKPVADVLILASGAASTATGVFAYGAAPTAGFRGGVASGTPTSPGATGANVTMCFMGGHGHDGTSFTTGTKALITFRAAELFSGSAQGTFITFETTTIGGTTRTEWMRLENNGDISLKGNSARVLAKARHTTSNTAGDSLTVQAGGATAAATNKAGGDLILLPGASTGTGRANVRLQNYSRGATGTADNVANDRLVICGAVNLTDAATSMYEVALASGAMTGGTIFWTIRASDGTDHQAYTGITTYAAVNKAAAYTTTVTSDIANDAKAVSAGTLTATFSILTGADKITLQVTPAGSLTENVYQMAYTLINNSPTAITIL